MINFIFAFIFSALIGKHTSSSDYELAFFSFIAVVLVFTLANFFLNKRHAKKY